MMHRQFLRFITVGGLSACVDIVVLYLILLTGLPDIIAITCGFTAGLLVNYLMHALYTFETQKLHLNSGLKFTIVVLANYIITIFCIKLLTETFFLSVVSAKVISLPIIAFNGYLLSKHWVFSDFDDE